MSKKAYILKINLFVLSFFIQVILSKFLSLFYGMLLLFVFFKNLITIVSLNSKNYIKKPV